MCVKTLMSLYTLEILWKGSMRLSATRLVIMAVMTARLINKQPPGQTKVIPYTCTSQRHASIKPVLYNQMVPRISERHYRLTAFHRFP